MATEARVDTRTAPTNGDDYVHIASFKESFWNGTVRGKIPRALCGVSLDGDPDQPEPGANAPVCPECAKRSAR